MKRLFIFLLPLFISAACISQNVINTEAGNNPVGINNEDLQINPPAQFALNNENPQVQINVNYNPPVQQQQVSWPDNRGNGQYNQQKAGQSIRVTSGGGGSYSAFSKSSVKRSHQHSSGYQIKKVISSLKPLRPQKPCPQMSSVLIKG
jgi:hypothetical protein